MSMAKDVDVFTIEWEGLDEFVDLLNGIERDHEKFIKEGLTDFGQLAEYGTKALVHHDEGTLEDSINFGEARKIWGHFEVTGGSNLVYAMRRHEEPYRLGTHHKLPKDFFYQNGLGRYTRNKPTWRFHKPGRKYLENAIKAIDKDYDKMNQEVLDKIMRSK